MSFRDRPYAGGGGQGGPEMGPSHLGLSLPRPGPVVKWLLIGTFATFTLQIFLDQPRRGSAVEWGWMTDWFGATSRGWWQAWRYLTFQFLHDIGGLWHVFFNMLGLYMLGVPLERFFGSRRFLVFYLSCGAVAGVAYVLVGFLAGQPAWVPIVGASGGVYGIILAAAVYFPHFRILFLFIPVPIRLAAGIIFGAMIFTVLGGLSQVAHGNSQAFGEAMSDVCHLGGALTALGWVLARRRRPEGPPRPAADGIVRRIRRGAWQRRMQHQARLQQEVDRILEKIHNEGLQSLSGHEKRLLKKATDERRHEDRRIKTL